MNAETGNGPTRRPRASGGHRLAMLAGAFVLTWSAVFVMGEAASASVLPAVSTVSPSSGSAGGGNKVVITGVAFNGATSVLFGTSSATSFTVNHAGTVVKAFAPSEPAGPVDVRIVTPAGESLAVSGDLYTFLPPSISGLSVTSGAVGGGTKVVIAGSNLAHATAVDFGTTPGTIVKGNRAGTSLTVLSPSHLPGLVDIEVTAAAGTTATGASDEFTYLGPSVTGVTPTGGTLSGTTKVVVSGQDFAGATAVLFGGIPATSISVNRSGTSIHTVAPIPPDAGTVDVTVVTPEATSLPVTADEFTYSPTRPSVSGVSPSNGSGVGGTDVTISGTNFANVSSVDFSGVPATSFVVVSSTTIDAVSPQLPIGTGNVTVTNDVGTNKKATVDQFTATSVGCPTPINGSWDGFADTASQDFSWEVNGALFTPTAVSGVYTMTGTVTVGGATSAVNANNTSLSCNTWEITDGNGAVLTGTLDPSGALVTMDPNGTNHGEAFDGYPALVSWGGNLSPVDNASPITGPPAGGTSVTITGTGFPADPVVMFGDQPATSVDVVSSSEIIAVSPAVSGTEVVVITVGTSAQDLNRTGALFVYQ